GVREVEGAAVARQALAGVEEQEAVEALEGVLAVTGGDLLQRLEQHARLVARPRPLDVIGPLLTDLDPLEDLPLQAKAAGRLLQEVIVQAAVNRLAGRTVLV